MVEARATDKDRRIFRCGRARRALLAAFVAVAISAGRAAADDGTGAIPLPSSVAFGSADAEGSSDAIASHTIAAPSGSFAGDAVRTVVALGAVLALALVARQVARKLMDPLAARRPSGVVQILARFPVSKGQTILLLSVGTRVLCVHQSAGRMETLSEFTDPTEIANLRTRIEAGSADRARFESELTRSLEREPAPGVASAPIVTETVDLTKRKPAAMRLAGVRA